MSILAAALCLGTLATGLTAFVLSTTATPAGATTPTVTHNTLFCHLGITGTVAETSSTAFPITVESYATPKLIHSGTTFQFAFIDKTAIAVPKSETGATVKSFSTVGMRMYTPAGATVKSVTITQQGYWYTAGKPTGTHHAIAATATIVTDPNSPSGKEIQMNVPTKFTTVPITLVLPNLALKFKAHTPHTSSLGFGFITAPPTGGSPKSADPAVHFVVTVTESIASEKVTTNCWPTPHPQPPLAKVTIVDTVHPAITIASPGATSKVVRGSKLHASFGCADPPAYGNGIKYCRATATGHPVTSGTLITSTVLGPHTVTVTASNNSTLTSTKKAKYTVILPPYNLTPPTVSITSPVTDAQYLAGSTVLAAYSCAPQGGTHIASCTGTVASGSPISTTAGFHTFTVKAKDGRGNTKTTSIGYYVRNSNTPTNTTSGTKVVTATSTTGNHSCSLGHAYETTSLDGASSSVKTCASGVHNPEMQWKVTAPGANAGQLVVGDHITVIEQIFKPGAHESTASTKGGYDSGAYKETFAIKAPAGTKLSGKVTTSATGLASSTYPGAVASARAASACNFNNVPATKGTSTFCNTTTGNYASTTVAAAGSTTVGAYGSTTVGTYGSTTVGAYGSSTVGTLYSSTVKATSNTKTVHTIATTAKKIFVASVTGAPKTSGRLEVTVTKTGTKSVAVFSYTGETGSVGFKTVVYVSGTKTAKLKTGAFVRQPLTVHNLTILPITATTGFQTTAGGTLKVITTAGGPSSAIVHYTSSTTSNTICGTNPCFTGVSYVSGSGVMAKGNTVTQVEKTIATGGTLHSAAVSGFNSSGKLDVATPTGTAIVSYTGTATTAATCGSTDCFTGVTWTSSSPKGVPTVGGAITQIAPNAKTFTGAATPVLHSAAVTGFSSTGKLTVATATGTVILSYSGTATTATTCGSTDCFTGVSYVSGGNTGKGAVSAGGALKQQIPLAKTFTGAATPVLHASALTGFKGSGTLSLATSTGTVKVTYTGTATTAATCGSTDCFTGVNYVSGGNSGNGTVAAGGAITQTLSTVSSFTGSGTFSVASITGLHAPGVLSVATTGGTAYLRFTGDSGTTITGVTDDSGTVGTLSPGGAVVQAGPGGNGYAEVTSTTTNNITVATFTGAGAINLAAHTFMAAPGTVQVTTTTGTAILHYTLITGSTLKGVSLVSGTGKIYSGAIVGAVTQTAIKGPAKVAGVTVSGWTWAVTVTGKTTFGVTWAGSSCQTLTGTGAKTTGLGACPLNANEKYGADGAYIYLKYQLVVTSTGTISIPGFTGISASAKGETTTGGILGTGYHYNSGSFNTKAVAAPGISWTAVDPNPPVATLSAPGQGTVFSYGQTVKAAYSCSEPTGGVTITSCKGVEDTGAVNVKTVATGGSLTTTHLNPNEIHTFKVTATNSEGYTATSYSSFTVLANPPTLGNQTISITLPNTGTVPFTYSGTYPATFGSEHIVTPPSHGTVTIEPTGKIKYTDNEVPFSTDTFQYGISDTADNPSNVATVTIHIATHRAPTITVVTPPVTPEATYTRHEVVSSSYTCHQPVEVGTCTATQTVTESTVNVPDGSPLDTTSLIIGTVHKLTIKTTNWTGSATTKQTVDYKVKTPPPHASTFPANDITPHSVAIHVLTHVTSTYPITVTSVKVVTGPKTGTVTVTTGVVTYKPTTHSTTVFHDSFTFNVKDKNGELSNTAKVSITIYPVPKVTAISPHESTLAGGGTITVTGTGFITIATAVYGCPCGTQVKFGTTPASTVHVVSGHQLTAKIPLVATTRSVKVRVITPGGTSTTNATTKGTKFTYIESRPIVTGISPTAGTPTGGTTVTITGSVFIGATHVKFGSVTATSFTVNANTKITAKSPKGTAGTAVDVTVSNTVGTSTTTSFDVFTYGPQVTGVSPSSGALPGGTHVTISGHQLAGGTVKFGANSATTVVATTTSITAVAPAGSALGPVDVRVTTAAGTSPINASDVYTYTAPAPSVSGVSPVGGPATGTNTVTVSGNAFTGATKVTFGGSAGSTISVAVGGKSLTVKAPAHGAGTVDVTVTTSGGTSPTNPSDHYTFGPTVTHVTPSSGVVAGGGTVTITGLNFTGLTAVKFGTNTAHVSSNSATKITVSAPAASSAGTVNVIVTAGGATSPAVTADKYTYTNVLPTVKTVSPSSGSALGGTKVTVTGTGFIGVKHVFFGGSAGTNPVANTAGTSLTVTSPAGTSGTSVDVRVTATGGESNAVAADKFTYGPTVTHISPTSGTVSGGTSVTITGTLFATVTTVKFGATPATTFTVNSTTQITATAPAATAAGPVGVTVVLKAGGGTTPTTTADTYTYRYPVPSVTSVSPSVGVAGNTVTISGSGFSSVAGANATAVKFGATTATSFTVVSSTKITAKVPAGTATTTVNITVTSPGGTSATSSADTFTYGPVITVITPNSGSHLGGTVVTIRGAGFTGATAVHFGTALGTSISVNATGTQITVHSPAHVAGSVQVTVTAGGHTSKTSTVTGYTFT